MIYDTASYVGVTGFEPIFAISLLSITYKESQSSGA